MSWQAIEAVQDHSTITDHTGLCLLYAIARFADADGVVGANGRLTSPSITTLADKARLSKQSVLNWLPKLEESGELIVERFGKGRGAWNRYTITLPIEDNGKDNGKPQDLPLDDNGQFNGKDNGKHQDLPKEIDELREMVKQLGVMVKDMVHNGKPQSLPDTNDTELDTEIYTYNAYAQPYPQPVAEIITALSKVSKTSFWAKTENDFESAAYTLFGFDATPDDIYDFSQWWQDNGHYEGKPALKSIMNEWANFTSGVTYTPKTAVNGKSAEYNEWASQYSQYIPAD